jgi:GTP cyclohydrolase I
MNVLTFTLTDMNDSTATVPIAMLPVVEVSRVARAVYLPAGRRVVGLSKIARTVDTRGVR